MAIKNVVGDWIHEEVEIKDFIRCGFEQIFLSSHSCVSRLDPAISQWQLKLSDLEKESISGGAFEEEIKAALWSLKPFKAPGPDALDAGFFQKFWHIVGKSVIEEVQKVFDDRGVPEALNSTHIALIPKI